MSYKMIYDERNKANLNKLADNTKVKAYKLYQYCIDNKIQILIYETIRTKAQQEENVRKGASKTMKSYHLVGQALDWVLVDSKKNALWNGYKSSDAQKVIKYAKSIGFVSGYDWGWDAPHLQYEHKGYGTDTFGKTPTSTTTSNNTSKGDDDELQFTSSTLEKLTLTALKDKTQRKLIVDSAIKLGASNTWLERHNSNKMTEGDYIGLAIKYLLDSNKKK